MMGHAWECPACGVVTGMGGSHSCTRGGFFAYVRGAVAGIHDSPEVHLCIAARNGWPHHPMPGLAHLSYPLPHDVPRTRADIVRYFLETYGKEATP